MDPQRLLKSVHSDSGLIQRLHSASALTSAVSGEVQQQDVGAEVVQVVQRLQVLLQFPAGQFGLEDGRQVTEHVGVQRRRPAESPTHSCLHCVLVQHTDDLRSVSHFPSSNHVYST